MRGLTARVRGLERATGAGWRQVVVIVVVGHDGEETHHWPPCFLGHWSPSERRAEAERVWPKYTNWTDRRGEPLSEMPAWPAEEPHGQGA